MSELPQIFLLFLLSYLLGSFPSGYLAGKIFKSIDIRQMGIGNTGATNVLKTVGAIPAVLVLTCDVAKGALATFLAFWFGFSDLAVWAGLWAVVGHNWPVFLSFRGGQGLATSLGVALVLVPIFFPIVCLAIGVVLKIFIRQRALPNLLAFLLLPLLVFWIQKETLLALGFATLVALRWLAEWPRLVKEGKSG